MVLVITAVLVSLVGGATALVSARTRLLEDQAQRIRLRSLAEQGLAQAARNWIDADTNAWDSMDEPWAVYRTFSENPHASRCAAFQPGDTFLLQIEDEYARVGITNGNFRCAEDLLLPENGRDGDAVPKSFETKAIISCSTGYTDGTINLNTVSKEAFFLLCSRLEGGGGENGTDRTLAPSPSPAALALWNRLDQIRSRGGVFHRATPDEALRLFQEYPAKTPPSAAEISLLGRLQPFLRVGGGLFRLSAQVTRGRTRIFHQVVYERSTHRIVRWVEM